MRLIVKNLSIDELYNIYKQELSEKAFGDLTLSRRANQLKDLTRDLRDFKNETVIKVFQALGYKVE